MPRKPKRKPVNLALQGGGAHGAYTWGVLDRLLQEDSLAIEAISGTSAGAVNAVVLASGLATGGIAGARERLSGFWKAVGASASLSPVRRMPWQRASDGWSLDSSPAFLFFDLISRVASPYDLNPMNFNPLRHLLDEHVDWQALRSCNDIKLFISATSVHTGKVRIFHTDDVTADAVLASACVPHLFQAVEIDGEPFWDGGFSGNPSLWPFFYDTEARDIVIVQINPIERRETPKTARGILNRVNEITFNASLLREFRAINFVSRLIEEGKLDEDDYRQVLVHLVSADEHLNPLGASSKLNAEWAFLTHLFEIGREAASRWCDAHYDCLGARSTVELRSLFQD